MKLLLDTHALLWWLAGDARRLSRRARAAIAEPHHVAHVSAASAWEIATKQRLGKLDASALEGRLMQVVAEQEFEELPISIEHAERAGLLPGEHRDPFDRMLIAQAQAERLVLVSNEEVFDEFGIQRLW
ncbi:MAG: twitching motility protein PilT [Gemmatimonadetes bacterium]|nr:twitching motility protein PilT [Gemmatimonadota bacterium]